MLTLSQHRENPLVVLMQYPLGYLLFMFPVVLARTPETQISTSCHQAVAYINAL